MSFFCATFLKIMCIETIVFFFYWIKPIYSLRFTGLAYFLSFHPRIVSVWVNKFFWVFLCISLLIVCWREMWLKKVFFGICVLCIFFQQPPKHVALLSGVSSSPDPVPLASPGVLTFASIPRFFESAKFNDSFCRSFHPPLCLRKYV